MRTVQASRHLSIPFSVGLLCLIGVVLLPLVGALLGIGWYATARLEEKVLTARIQTIETSIGTLLDQGFRTIAYTQQSLADSGAFASTAVALSPQPTAGSQALSNMLARHPNVVASYVGFQDGSFLYVTRVDRLAPARQQEIMAPAGAVLAIRVIHAGPGTDTWTFQDAAGAMLASHPSPRGDFDPRTRGWFSEAAEARSSILTEPYAFQGGGGIGITVATPLPEKAGVIGTDIRVDVVSRLLKTFSVSPSNVILIATGAGNELVRAGPQALESVSADGLIDWMRSEIRRVAQHNAAASVETVTVSGVAMRLHVKALPSTSGRQTYLAIAAPVSELTEETGALIARSMRVAVAATIIALAGGALASRLLSRPLAQIASKTDQFRHLDFSNVGRVGSRVREISRLENAVEQMRGGLEQFGRYVPRQLVRRVIDSSTGADVGGSRQAVTVLFTDIDRFSQTTETMEPEQLMARLSKYLESLGGVLTQHGGTIDKYIGDSIMAIWNAPDADADHVANACRAALAAARTSERLEAKWQQRGRRPFRTRCGLHTGVAVVGNVGSLDRLSYTVVGAVPNVASRLESLNKVYGTQILASGPIYHAAPDRFVWREIDRVVPAGTTLTLDVYELMGEPPAPGATGAPQRDAFLEKWNDALAAYRRGDMATAAGAFDALVLAYPADGPCRTFAARCHSFLEDGLPKDWSGVTVFREK